MKAAPGEHEDLRIAAKVADREKAADAQRPAFEKLLRELGYGHYAIARAFAVLKGPGTVEDALRELKRHSR